MVRDEKVDELLPGREEILDMMEDRRVFGISLSSDSRSFVIREMCDEYFAVRLTKDQCLELSKLFADLAERTHEL